MAEETVKVPEAVVIPYGQESIDYNKFLTNAADSVQSYVDKQPWSKKRKEYFWQAYNDLMSRGITGASNDAGVWTVNHKGDAVPLESLPKKLQEMYGEAAYFIQQQMSKIPVQVKEEEEKKKQNLQLFDNDYFTNSFNKHIGLHFFGGRKWDTQENWNVLDPRGENGLRGRKVRAAKLIEALQTYSDSLKEGAYNFEGTAFKDLADLKSKINNAIEALKTEDPNDDTDALNRLGLDANVYFNDGSGDQTTDAKGNPITYGELYKRNQELAKKHAAEEQQKLVAQRKANLGVMDFEEGIHGTDAATNPQAYSEYIAKNLGTGQQGFNAMNAAVQNLINAASTHTLDSVGKRQLGNFLYYIRTNNPNYQKSNITDQEWTELNTHNSLKSTNRAGFVRLPWQTPEGRYTYADDKGNLYFLKPANHQKFNAPAIQRSAAYNNYKNNFLKGPTQIPRGGGMELTTDDYVDLGAIAADFISLVDPEPISAGLLGAGAGIARATNADWDNHFWRSLGSAALDIGTGAIGALPAVGDSILAVKVLKNLAKYGRFISYYIASKNLGPAKQAWDKIDFSDPSSLLKLTPDDYRAIYNVLQGMVAGKHTVTSRLAQREALKHRGYEVSNRWDKKLGLTSTKSGKPETTVKVKLNGKEEDIIISPGSKEKLDRKLKKAGNDVEAQHQAVREVEEVQQAARNKGIKEEDFKSKIEAANTDHKVANMPGIKLVAGNTKQHYGTTTRTARPNKDDFEDYLNNRSVWSKMLYSKRTLRAFDPEKGVPKGSSSENIDNPPSEKVDNPPSKNTGNPPINRQRLKELREKFGRSKVEKSNPKQEYNQKQQHRAEKEVDLFMKYYGGKNSSGRSGFIGGYGSSTNKIKPGEYSFDLGDGKTVKFSITKEDLSKNSIIELRHRIQQQIKNSVLDKTDVVTVGKILRKLKKQGFLKQGGQINKSTEQIITDFINNQK